MFFVGIPLLMNIINIHREIIKISDKQNADQIDILKIKADLNETNLELKEIKANLNSTNPAETHGEIGEYN